MEYVNIWSRNSSVMTMVLAIFACLLWSTAFVGVKIGLHYSGPFFFAGIRFMMAGLMLIPIWWKRKPNFLLVHKNVKSILLVSFFQTFLMYGLFYLAMTMVSGAIAAIIIGSSPLTAAVVANYVMEDDAMTMPKCISLLLGMAGVVILSVSREPWASPEGLREFTGIVLLFLCTVSSAFGNVLVAREKSDMDPVFLTSLQIFLGGFFLFLVSIPLEGLPAQALPREFYIVLFWLSWLSAVAFALWFVLLQRPGVKVSQINIWKFIIPVCGALLSWTFLPDESPGVSSIVGMITIAVSLIFFNLDDLRRKSN